MNSETIQENNIYALDFIYRQLVSGIIDLAADYQRDVVWDIERQSTLINSLYFGFYVFPVLLSRRGTNVPLVCIDGKQRLTSVLKFFNNEIPLILHDSKIMYYYSSIPATKRTTDYAISVFTTEMKLRIESKGLSVVTFIGLEISREKEIFHRIQNGMPLTSGEKLKAVTCAATAFAAELNAGYFSHFEKLMARTRANDGLLFLRAVAISRGNIKIMTSTKFKAYITDLQVDEALRNRTKRLIESVVVLIGKGVFANLKLSGLIAITTIMIIVNEYIDYPTDDLVSMIVDVIGKVREDMKEMHNKWFTIVQTHI